MNLHEISNDLVALRDLYEIEEFCDSNGYNLKDLKYEEVNAVLDLITEYEQKEKIIDADFKEVEEDLEKIVQTRLDM